MACSTSTPLLVCSQLDSMCPPVLHVTEKCCGLLLCNSLCSVLARPSFVRALQPPLKKARVEGIAEVTDRQRRSSPAPSSPSTQGQQPNGDATSQPGTTPTSRKRLADKADLASPAKQPQQQQQRRKPKKMTPEIEVRVAIQNAARDNDPKAALAAYDRAKAESIPLKEDVLHNLLFVCSGGNTWVDHVREPGPLGEWLSGRRANTLNTGSGSLQRCTEAYPASAMRSAPAAHCAPRLRIGTHAHPSSPPNYFVVQPAGSLQTAKPAVAATDRSQASCVLSYSGNGSIDGAGSPDAELLAVMERGRAIIDTMRANQQKIGG